MSYDIEIPTDDGNITRFECGADVIEYTAYVYMGMRTDHVEAFGRLPLAQAEKFLARLITVVADAKAEQSLIDSEGI